MPDIFVPEYSETKTKSQHMKKLLGILLLAGTLAACGSDSDKKADDVKDQIENKVDEMKDKAGDMKDSLMQKVDEIKDSAASKIEDMKSNM